MWVTICTVFLKPAQRHSLRHTASTMAKGKLAIR